MPVRISVTAQGEGVSLSGAADFNAEDFARFLAAFRAKYGPIGTGEVDGVPTVRDMTPAEVWAKFTGELAVGAITQIEAHDRTEAQKALAVAPVRFSKVG